MKLIRLITALAMVCATFGSAFAQSTYLPNPGKYGLSAWAVNGQRVASQYNYYIDSIWGSGLGAFSFPASTIYQAIPKGSQGNLNPFNTNATVKIIDINSSNTETVAFNSQSCTTGAGVAAVCTLSLANSNAHTSYVLRSGTCGLKEALNDLGSSGGEVIVDQRFYDDGCTQAQITGTTAVAGALANQYIHDISNGQDTWYEIKPSTTSLIAAGAALTLTGSAGGSLTNSGTYRVSYEYVDALGGQSLPATTSSQISLSSQNTITTSVPAASTGAVGWIPMITASGGADGTQIAVPVTSSVCTLSILTPYATCAMASAAVITANPSATSKENVEGFAHTTFAYTAISGVPSVSGANTWGDFQTAFQPFVVGATINSGATANEDLAQVYVPAGYFNKFGGVYDVCVKGAVATAVASSVMQLNLTLAANYAQSPVTVSQVTFPTLTLGAAGTFNGCFQIQTAATGSSGTFWGATDGAFQLTLNSTQAPVTATDVTTAVSSAVDLTKNLYLSVNMADTTANNITGPIINELVIKPVLNN